MKLAAIQDKFSFVRADNSRDQHAGILANGDDFDEWKQMPISLPSRRTPPPEAPPRPIWLRPLLGFSLFLGIILAYHFITQGVPELPEVPSYATVKEAVANRLKSLKEVALPSDFSAAQSEAGDICGGERDCRFLVPPTVGEQESRAQLHFLQLAALATALNRTLVLPRAYPSRFSTCGTSSFDFLYQPSTFAAETGTNPVLQRDFELWLANRSEPAQTRAVRLSVEMADEPPVETLGKFVPDATNGWKPLYPCLDGSTLDLGKREALVSWQPWHEDGAPIIEDLRTLDAQDPVDVLLLHYNLRGPLFPLIEKDAIRTGALERAFTYEAEWSKLADKVLELFDGEAIGIHWRTEQIDADTLGTCGESLERVLMSIKEEDSAMRIVYLASDFPIEELAGSPYRLAVNETPSSTLLDAGKDITESSTHAHSDTLTPLLTPAHYTAMQSFLTGFRLSSAPADVTLYTFASLRSALLHAAPELERWIDHAAARAIIDQLVLQRTEVFLAGYPTKGNQFVVDGRRSCGKHSNWTNRVAAARAVRMAEEQGGGEKEGTEDGGRRLKNVLARWSADGQVDGLPEAIVA
ncbi:hypothetical protein JCM11641_002839 [Rhodosporidiobolus odoratus]